MYVHQSSRASASLQALSNQDWLLNACLNIHTFGISSLGSTYSNHSCGFHEHFWFPGCQRLQTKQKWLFGWCISQWRSYGRFKAMDFNQNDRKLFLKGVKLNRYNFSATDLPSSKKEQLKNQPYLGVCPCTKHLKLFVKCWWIHTPYGSYNYKEDKKQPITFAITKNCYQTCSLTTESEIHNLLENIIIWSIHLSPQLLTQKKPSLWWVLNWFN